MQFRLIYDGPLHSGGNKNRRTQEKHDIRKQFHIQLRELWRVHPSLRQFGYATASYKEDGTTRNRLEDEADQFARLGYRFLPLVSDRRGVACSLSVLFLRRDGPGALVRSGGDIDGRIKVLFDALKMPNELSELGGALPEDGEDPFYCLLQDDRLITEVGVTTDRLLIPVTSGEHEHNVRLVVHVDAFVVDQERAGLWFHAR